LEDLYVKEIIDKLEKYELTPLERVILANEGTVQSLLSVIFRVPVEVEVISQVEINQNIVRWARLAADYGEAGKVTVCLAESVIPPVNNIDFLEGIKDRENGIGRLLTRLNFVTEREILGFYADDTIFSRTYRITGQRVDQDQNIRAMQGSKCDILITEVFPRSVYNTNLDE